MNTEEIKKIYLVLNELESAERQLEWEKHSLYPNKTKDYV